MLKYFIMLLFLSFNLFSQNFIPPDPLARNGSFEIFFNYNGPIFNQFEFTDINKRKTYHMGSYSREDDKLILTRKKEQSVFSLRDYIKIRAQKLNFYQTFTGELLIKDEKFFQITNPETKEKFISEISDVKLLRNENGVIFENEKFTFEYETSTERKEKEEKEVCKKNINTKIILINVKSDNYGISSSLYDLFTKQCFDIIDFYQVYDYLYQENIDLEKIDEYILRKIGEHFNVDKIYFGNSYIVNIPLKYTATTSDNVSGDISSNLYNDNPLFGIIDDVLDIQEIETQEKARNAAINTAGTYVYLTYYSIDVKSGQKEYIYINNPTIKLD